MRCDFCGSVGNAVAEGGHVCSEVLAPLLVRNVEDVGIYSVAEWFEAAPPKQGLSQWKLGFSARESAEAWFRDDQPSVPVEIQALFESHPLTAGVRVATAVPEMQTKLDEYRGARNADVVLFGTSGGRRLLAAIEAKAGEDFGPLIGPYLKRVVSGTNVPERVDMLSTAIFGRPAILYDGPICALRYQLLHGLAGTLIEAHSNKADVAAMVIHYFPNSRRLMQESLDEVNRFVATVGQGRASQVEPGRLVEFHVPGGFQVPVSSRVLLGWATAPGVVAGPAVG